MPPKKKEPEKKTKPKKVVKPKVDLELEIQEEGKKEIPVEETQEIEVEPEPVKEPTPPPTPPPADVYCDPTEDIRCLPKSVIELHHGRKNQTRLRENIRLKQIYAFKNEIESLSSTSGEGIESLKFLRGLYLADNLLRDFSLELRVLSKFMYLEELDLSGNPITFEPDYRSQVIAAVPSLLVLDMEPVTTLERETERKRTKLAFGKPIVPNSIENHKKGLPWQLSDTEQFLLNETFSILDHWAQKEFDKTMELYKDAPKPQSPRDHLPLPPDVDFLKRKRDADLARKKERQKELLEHREELRKKEAKAFKFRLNPVISESETLL